MVIRESIKTVVLSDLGISHVLLVNLLFQSERSSHLTLPEASSRFNGHYISAAANNYLGLGNNTLVRRYYIIIIFLLLLPKSIG